MKKKPEFVEWVDLKVGDFVESKDSYLFCFSIGNVFGGPSCLGQGKPKVNNPDIEYINQWLIFGKYKRFTPSKPFIKLCKKLLKYNLKQKHIDNLSYIESLASLKKYD